MKEVLALLSPEQVAQWRKMTGEPFTFVMTFPAVNPRPGEE
jgi:hypothetical protein